jgi:hypothetical protein
VNLYKSADASEDNVLTVMASGAFFKVIEADADWIVIDMDGETAYVPASDVTLTAVKPEPTAAPAVQAEPTESPEPTETPAPSETPAVSETDGESEETENLEEEL